MESTTIPAQLLDGDAVSVVGRLQDAGYIAYLVGGCVRDALLGREPKDYDIATSATPDELRSLFGRRCRLIGRRFKLAHVRAGAKIFEVATFRGRPEDQDVQDDSGFVVRANTFGSPEEDAVSRDFTMNGLFYDPFARRLHDHVGGLDDIRARRIRTIGDAEQRFREDPVRILRAVKFAGRLALDLDPGLAAVSGDLAGLVHDCPVARVTEELFRLLESGYAEATVRVARRLGVLEAALPEVADAVEDDDAFERWCAWLRVMDRLVLAHGTLPRESTFVLVAWPLLRASVHAQAEGDWGLHATERVQDAASRMAIPIRHRQHLRGTANLLRRIVGPPRRRRQPQIGRSPSLPTALTVLRMEFLCGFIDAPPPGYESFAADSRALGITPGPFEPRVEETDAGSAAPTREREDDGGGGGRRRRSRRRSRGRKPAADG
ncbi:MAG: polynucleotide adenylyltransferase PcnB [Deltaproteobacteria bacterium]|nr:polynucleotide adenylyltransferase PcnB [Deltaproteobacteria bacterium]MCB9788796.1 polynucleotide adenylyltransferase PcnB [Deltaproteobacteria bacterium]